MSGETFLNNNRILLRFDKIFIKVYVRQVFVNVRLNFISSGHYVRQALKNYLQPWQEITFNRHLHFNKVVCQGMQLYERKKVPIALSSKTFEMFYRTAVLFWATTSKKSSFKNKFAVRIILTFSFLMLDGNKRSYLHKQTCSF